MNTTMLNNVNMFVNMFVNMLVNMPVNMFVNMFIRRSPPGVAPRSASRRTRCQMDERQIRS